MRIEGIVVACYALDVELTRICVASVRAWYPDIPIWLLKDVQYGDFSTWDLEKYAGVRVLDTGGRNLGWGFGKLEAMSTLPSRRWLVIDSDIVFVGRVLDALEEFNEDMVVAAEEYDEAGISENFFSLGGLRQLDPDFRFPGFAFNTGQIVATTGRIGRKDFAGLLDWDAKTMAHPDVFKKGEQGLLNYVVQRKVQKREMTVRRHPFMRWPGKPENVGHINVGDLSEKSPYRELIHWAGLRWGKRVDQMPRADILLHFETLHYARIPFGKLLWRWRCLWSHFHRAAVAPLKQLVKRLIGR